MYGAIFANDMLKLILHQVAIAGIADVPAVGKLNNLWLGLHTADPGPAGTQETSAVVYTGYARKSVGFGPSVWAITGDKANPVARIEFAEMTGGIESLATWVTIGTTETGPGKILMRGRLSPDIQCRLGVIPAIKQDTVIKFVSASS